MLYLYQNSVNTGESKNISVRLFQESTTMEYTYFAVIRILHGSVLKYVRVFQRGMPFARSPVARESKNNFFFLLLFHYFNGIFISQ